MILTEKRANILELDKSFIDSFNFVLRNLDEENLTTDSLSDYLNNSFDEINSFTYNNLLNCLVCSGVNIINIEDQKFNFVKDKAIFDKFYSDYSMFKKCGTLFVSSDNQSNIHFAIELFNRPQQDLITRDYLDSQEFADISNNATTTFSFSNCLMYQRKNEPAVGPLAITSHSCINLCLDDFKNLTTALYPERLMPSPVFNFNGF